uniref:Uncharacterized protein n=1 Tax=Magallana gigas TaxID=29159 RepID=A0A8W8NQC4_MAGGI
MNFLGCTPEGYFGSNCSIPCPDVNCQKCHMESGICYNCKQGYKGQRCETGKDSLHSINHLIFKSHVMSTFRMSLETMIIVKSYGNCEDLKYTIQFSK